MASGQDSSGTTLMDLITSDPSAAPAAGPSSQQSSGGSIGGSLLEKPTAAPADRKSKKGTLMQIQNDTISAAKALNPVKALPQRNRKKKPVSYAQLARSIHELAATCDQKSSQRQLVNSAFPKLAVYNSVDPSVAPSLLMVLPFALSVLQINMLQAGESEGRARRCEAGDGSGCEARQGSSGAGAPGLSERWRSSWKQGPWGSMRNNGAVVKFVQADEDERIRFWCFGCGGLIESNGDGA